MRALTFAVMVALSLLSGCGNLNGIRSDDGGRGYVELHANGIYIVGYKWPYVENRYGRDRHTAVPAYLEESSLMPAECTHGVVVLRGGETEGGWGWAEFRCSVPGVDEVDVERYLREAQQCAGDGELRREPAYLVRFLNATRVADYLGHHTFAPDVLTIVFRGSLDGSGFVISLQISSDRGNGCGRISVYAVEGSH